MEKDKKDKAALGYDYKGETEKHESQRGEWDWEGEAAEEPRACFLPCGKLSRDRVGQRDSWVGRGDSCQVKGKQRKEAPERGPLRTGLLG